MTAKFFVRSFLSFFLIVSVCLMNVNVAFADDPTPPPATQEPTEEVTTPVQEPVATETPVADDPSVNGEQPPAESETPISELISQLPEETSLVVLDQNGVPVPLASEDAAEIVLEADPIWCPATAPAPIPNAGGCTQYFATPALLLAFLQANQNDPLYQKPGTIFLEQANVVNVPVFIDAALFPVFKNYDLTVKGGWNNTDSAPAGTTSTFDNNNNAYLHIGSSLNPWVGNVTIQDIFVQDNTVTNAPSIEVYTTNGSVTLNNVDTDDIDNSTAINVVVTGMGNVNLIGVDVSDGTDGNGINVTTNSGNITLSDVDVSNQADGNTANIVSTSGNITVNNGSSFDGDNTGGDTNQGFIASTNTGTITITGTMANPITFTDAEGSGNGTNYSGATLSAPTITLTRVTTDGNDLNGIRISNANSVTLSNVTATDNGTNPFGANNSVGSGVYIQGPVGGTNVTVDGGYFARNERYGIEITNGTITTINAPLYGTGGNANGYGNLSINTAPTLNLPANITAEATSSAGRTITFTVSSTDAEDNPDPAPTCAPASGSVFAIATTTVNCSVTDSKGVTTTGSFTVTIQDTTAPALTLPANITQEATIPAGGVVNFTASANDLVDGVRTVTCAPASGSTFPVSTTTVNCSTTDTRGNTSTGNFTVTIQDTTAPSIAAQGNVTAEATSAAGAAVTYTSPATTDLVDGAGIANCSPLSGSTFAFGNTLVTCNAVDAHGNAAVPTVFTITVQDTTAPTLNLPADMNVPATGPAGAVVTYSASASDLVDASVSVSCLPASGSTFPIGANAVNCSVTDDYGNTATGSFTVTVQDTTAPALTLPANITVEATGAAGTSVTYSASAFDAVEGAVAVSCSPASGNTFALGTTTVNCSAADLQGNTANGSFTITVEDTTAPTLNLPANMNMEATEPGGAVGTYIASASDLVDPSVPVICSPATGSIFALGTTTVNCSGTDDAGNTTNGSFTVTVQDTTAPTLTLPANMTEEATSAAGAPATYSASAMDAVDGVVLVACSPASGSTFALGTTTVNCSATDSHGNSSAGKFTITVEDTTAPTLILSANITVEATGPTGATVTYSASATDLVDASVPVSCSPASGSVFAIGTTTVNCSGSDDYGNTANGSFTVIVGDTGAPVLNLPANITAEATSAAGAAVTYTASASDIVDGAITVTCSPTTGSTFALGVTTVDCSATDSNSNTTQGSFTVTVQDTTAPVIAQPANIVASVPTLSGSKNVTYTLPSTTDAVDGMGTAMCSPVSGTAFKVGTWTVTCKATDAHGNAATPVTFSINIQYISTSAAPGSTSLIPVTGDETIELDCNTRITLNGIKVIFYNLCAKQAILNVLDANTLPGALPAGTTFVTGLNITTLDQSKVLDVLPASTGIEVDFPSGNTGNFAVLFWDGSKWVEVTQTLKEADITKALSEDASNELYKVITSDSSLLKMLTTENTGTFVLIKK